MLKKAKLVCIPHTRYWPICKQVGLLFFHQHSSQRSLFQSTIKMKNRPIRCSCLPQLFECFRGYYVQPKKLAHVNTFGTLSQKRCILENRDDSPALCFSQRSIEYVQTDFETLHNGNPSECFSKKHSSLRSDTSDTPWIQLLWSKCPSIPLVQGCS